MLTTYHRKTGGEGHVPRTFVLTILALLLVATAPAQNAIDVTKMSVEDLMNMQVTSVSKRTQKVADAAAAIFVLTQEDIRRSGATSIPEALRLVPGVQVARSGPSALAGSTGVSPTSCWC
jgi:iron complex outermembrane receptor protein